jgi:SnoaL-like protein
VTRTVTPREAVAVNSPSGRPGGAETVARLALTLDASGDAKADTLYAPDALVVENARVRLGAPRFAAIANQAGRVTITSATENVEGRFAWVLLDYNWVNPAERRVEPGRATVICERRGESWKIVHVHSSQPLPWEP